MLPDDRFPLNHLLTIFCQFSQQIRISLTGVSTNNVNEFVAPSAFFILASGDIQCSSYIYIDWAILSRILVKKISVQVVSLKSNQQHVIRNIFQKEHSSRSVSVYVLQLEWSGWNLHGQMWRYGKLTFPCYFKENNGYWMFSEVLILLKFMTIYWIHNILWF